MAKTSLFKLKYLNSCYSLKKFLKNRGIEITIYSEYVTVGKFDTEPTEFLYIQYPNNKEIQLLIEYWAYTNNVEFL